MTLSGLLLFCGVYAIAVLSPGPAAAAVIARVLGTGVRRSAPFIWGIVFGDLVWFALVSLGLAALAENFHSAFLIVKYAGVAYLMYLAWKLWTAVDDPASIAPPVPAEARTLFLGGLALTLGNPKVMVFFLSILPLVVDLSALDAQAALAIAVSIIVILSAAMWTYALVAERARLLISNPRTLRYINRGTGTVMAGAAVAVATRY